MVWVRPSQYSLISGSTDFKQWRDAVLAGELVDALLDRIVFESIDDLAPLAQHQRHHDVGEALPMCVGPGSVRSMTPQAQARELVEQRPLDVVALVEAERLT